MSLIEESEAECLTILDDLLPLLMLLSFILGFIALNYLKMWSSEYADKKEKSSQSKAKIEDSYNNKGF